MERFQEAARETKVKLEKFALECINLLSNKNEYLDIYLRE